MSSAKSDARSNSENAVTQLTALLSDEFASVNAVIMDQMQSDVQMIPDLAGYLIASGGKRIRPLLTLASAALCDYKGERQIALAACVEFIHTATLLHDDVVDESALRRGKETANEVWSNAASVLVGDFLFSRAFQLMVADGSLEVLRILSDASALIAEGEVHQLTISNDLTTDKAAYLSVIEAKTAILFQAACEVGAVVANAGTERQDALRSYGMNLGVAFQLIDDLLDYSANQEKLGKSIGDDFREGKMTLPLIVAISKADADEMSFWKRTIEDLDQTDEDFQTALKLVDKYDGLQVTRQAAHAYVESARSALAIFPASAINDRLNALLDFIVERSH